MIPLTLSESIGGAAILLDDASVPGKLVHANPVDSGANDKMREILIGNLNDEQVSIFTRIVGPGIPPVFSRDEMLRIDIPPSPEGTQVRQFYTSFLLAPGYSYYVSCTTPQGGIPPYLFGYVERYPLDNLSDGYGSATLNTPTILGDGSLGSDWDTFPWDTLGISRPENVDFDFANNRLQVNAPGIWQLTIAGALTFTETNQGRRTSVRVYNETLGAVEGMLTNIFAGRNQEGVNFSSAAILNEISENEVGSWFRVEVGGGDTFASVNADSGTVSLIKIDELP